MRKRLRCHKWHLNRYRIQQPSYTTWAWAFTLNGMRACKRLMDRLLEELLGTSALDAPVEFGSNVFDLLSQPLSIWGEVDNHSKLLHSCRSYGMRWSER